MPILPAGQTYPEKEICHLAIIAITSHKLKYVFVEM